MNNLIRSIRLKGYLTRPSFGAPEKRAVHPSWQRSRCYCSSPDFGMSLLCFWLLWPVLTPRYQGFPLLTNGRMPGYWRRVRWDLSESRPRPLCLPSGLRLPYCFHSTTTALVLGQWRPCGSDYQLPVDYRSKNLLLNYLCSYVLADRFK